MLRYTIAQLSTPEEAQQIKDATLEEHRAAYDLAPPNLPKSQAVEYEERFSGWEQDFLALSRAAGFDSTTVRSLRDHGIEMAIAAEGRAVNEQQWAEARKKFPALSDAQFDWLKTWWKKNLEGAS